MVKQGAGLVGKKDKLFLLLGAIVALLAFLFIADPSKYYFLNDDFFHIPLAAKNNFVQNVLLRPVSDFSLRIDNMIWGKNAFGYHLTNMLIHIANTYLVWLLARLFFRRYDTSNDVDLKSALAAILFLLYAFHSEPIFWIIGRGGSLSTLFCLLACRAYLDRQESRWAFSLALLFFGIGLFTYESIFVFPVIVLFISIADVCSLKTRWKREWLYPGRVLLLFIIFLVARKAITGTLTGEYGMQSLIQFNFSRLIYNYNTLLARTILPPLQQSTLFLSLYIAIIILSFIGLVSIVKKKGANTLLFLLLACLLISLSPAISLGIDTHDSESERFIYLPSVFFVLLLVEFFFCLITRKAVFVGAFSVIILLNGLLLARSASAYRFAGVVVKQSLGIINVRAHLQTIHAVNLPLQFRGALIFRSGFEEAVNWICTECIHEHIDTIGSFEYLNAPVYFLSEEMNVEAHIDNIVVTRNPNSATGSLEVRSGDHAFAFSKGKDMILRWTDSSVMKIK